MALVNDIVTRFYVNGDWRDVSTDVRAARGISYSRGRQGEDDTTPPQRCSFDLDNRDGTWSDRNPLGVYYGHLRRNTPMEMALRVVRDTATTAVGSGWGSTDTATGDAEGAWQVEAWTSVGGTGYSKAAGKAVHSLPSASTARASYLADFRGRDVDVRFRVSTNIDNVTGGGSEQGLEVGNLLLRGQGAAAEYFRLAVLLRPDQAVTMDWSTHDGVSLTGGPTTAPDITHASSNVYRVRARAEGRSLRAKLWLDGTAEPYDWLVAHCEPADNPVTANIRDAQGWVGMRTAVATGCTNINVEVSYDDFEICIPVFAGEIAEWPQERDVTGADRLVGVVAEGPRRRFAQGNSLTRSAIYTHTRYSSGTGQVPPAVYWPLEGGQQTGLDTVDVMGTTSYLRFNQPNTGSTVGKIKWGADTSRPGSLRSPTITGGGSLNGTLQPPTGNQEWGIQWQQRLNYREGVTSTFQTLPLAGGSGEITVATVMAAGSQTFSVALAAPGINTFIMAYEFETAEEVDEWHTLAITAEQSGSDVFFNLMVDSETVDSHTQSGLTLAGLTYVGFASIPDSTGDMAIGHIAVYNGGWGSWDFLGADYVANGHAGDSPVYRGSRLADEYGFAYDWASELWIFSYSGRDGKAMGPQRVASLNSLLDDCERVDGGLLIEQRSLVGFMFKDLTTLLSRSPWLTLDMGTSKHLTPPLTARTDDRSIVNSATAQRPAGGEWTYTQNDGPLGAAPATEGGIGEYPKQLTFNVDLETDLRDLASWAVAKGTVDQERYPNIVVDLHRPSVYNTSGLVSALRDLDVGDLIGLSSLESNYVYDDPDELVLGIAGYLDKRQHTLTLNTVPGEVHRTLVLGDTAATASELSRLDSDTTTLDEDLDATETSVTVEVAADSAFWVDSTDYADHFPFVLTVGGEQMTATACTQPVGQNQTFTVVRNINGLPGGKTHSAGAKVSLHRPNYYGL